ncbi:MAG: NUDIX hydrolase [Rhodocyclaceae bacterium]|nr:NUDIX hydrolase [Rhodocyclaceae bacterium]
MKFCSACGATVTMRIPQGDTALRHVCDTCGEIHYQNPKLVVGAIALWGDQILLCRRAIEPRLGKWTLPAGFMENEETTAEAAARETLEEACARVEIDAPFAMVNIPRISQVHLFYRGRLLAPDFAAGDESLEVGLFDEADIPWDTLAFRSVGLTLTRFFEDRRKARFGFHSADLDITAPLAGHGT